MTDGRYLQEGASKRGFEEKMLGMTEQINNTKGKKSPKYTTRGREKRRMVKTCVERGM
jgi:hypothetical protein